MSCRKLLALLMINLTLGLPAMGQTITPGPACLRPVPDVDPRKSIFVTELDVVQNAISLEDVLGLLARQSGIPGLEAIDLWDQWWDTQNTSPGLGLGLNCDDRVDANGIPVINRFPIECPRNEGAEINIDPFDPASSAFYEPIALVNRMDLMPSDGANCGEYRVIFARRSGVNNRLRRNLVIFEATLPNPRPGGGSEGCREIAEFWASLSRISDPMARAALLREFYLRGDPSQGIEPVIHISHLSPGAGQIRTNQFLNTQANSVDWQLREYKLALFCTGPASNCELQFVPVSVKTNPWGQLYDEFSGQSQTRRFMRQFLTQVDELANPDITQFSNSISNEFNAGQSNSQGSENDYTAHFDPSGNFARAIQRRLRNLGSPLSPTEIIRRSQTQSCAGCHQLNNTSPANLLGDGMVWPQSLGFVHVTERATDSIGGVPHFRISPALDRVFVPHRERVFESYLADLPCIRCMSLPLGDGSNTPDFIAVPAVPDGSAPLPLTPAEIEILDADRKMDSSAIPIGGPRGIH